MTVQFIPSGGSVDSGDIVTAVHVHPEVSLSARIASCDTFIVGLSQTYEDREHTIQVLLDGRPGSAFLGCFFSH